MSSFQCILRNALGPARATKTLFFRALECLCLLFHTPPKKRREKSLQKNSFEKQSQKDNAEKGKAQNGHLHRTFESCEKLAQNMLISRTVHLSIVDLSDFHRSCSYGDMADTGHVYLLQYNDDLLPPVEIAIGALSGLF